MTATQTDLVTVTITRDKQYKTALRAERYEWKWTYSWTASDGSHLVPSGDRMVNIGSYGTHLASLHDMLRRKYGKRMRIVEAWKAEDRS